MVHLNPIMAFFSISIIQHIRLKKHIFIYSYIVQSRFTVKAITHLLGGKYRQPANNYNPQGYSLFILYGFLHLKY